MAEAMAYPENDPRHHTLKLHGMLTAVVQHAREDIGKINEPKAQALFETTAEVCAGLATAMEHYQQQKPAWRLPSRTRQCVVIVAAAYWCRISCHLRDLGIFALPSPAPASTGRSRRPGRDSPAVTRPRSDSSAHGLPASTARLGDITDMSGSGATYLAGGHGTMRHFTPNADQGGLLDDATRRDAIIAAVCHGTTGLPSTTTPGSLVRHSAPASKHSLYTQPSIYLRG